MKIKHTNKLVQWLIPVAMAFSALPVQGDDTEALLGANVAPLDPKVLFIFDNSGSMSSNIQDAAPGEYVNRVAAAKRALLDILFAPENADIDFGLMAFNHNGNNNNDGGRVIFRLQNIDSTNRGANPVILDDNDGNCETLPAAGTLARAICDLRTDTWTPLAETMYEAYRYFRGETVLYGDENPTGINPPKDASAEASGTYKSPFYDVSSTTLQQDRNGDNQIDANDITCEQAYIVLMTDGEPTIDTDADDAISALTGVADQGDTSSYLDDIAGYMFENDMDGNPDNDIQRVMTYTVGLEIDNDLLESTAVLGGSGTSGYFVANNASQLADSFNALFAEINASSATYTTPGVGGSVANDARSLNYVYYSFFTPTEKSRWDGNLKKYRLADLGSGLQVVDVNNNLVFNASGEINSVQKGDSYNAVSIWSAEDDADVVTKGGAGASITDYSTRTVYTQISNSTLELFNTDNSNITDAMLLVSGSTERNALINWARGQDPDDSTKTRWVMGDPLHSAPIIINYGKRENSSTYAGDYSDLRILVGTNAGFLHMFQDDLGGTSNGCSGTKDSNNICDGYTTGDSVAESWAFIPSELYHILSQLKANPATGSHPYGVDGTVGVYIDDKNKDGNICVDADCDSDGTPDGDQVVAVFGLRRGVNVNGNGFYYALDISNPDAPQFLWKFGHDIMEQGWATPQFGKIRYFDGSSIQIKNVAIFSAGYDTDKDEKDIVGTDDDKGRGVFVVDLADGSIIWSVQGEFTPYCSNTAYTDQTTCEANSATWITPVSTANVLYEAGLKDSMPANVTVVDVDGDGYLDRMYIPDTGGNVWRIDMYNNDVYTKLNASEPNTNDSRTEWSIFQVAQLGRHESATLADDRRFFNQIDFVQTRDQYGNYDALIFGSGHRNNPNEQNTNNRIYKIRDTYIGTYKFNSSCADSTAIDYDPACKIKPAVLSNSDLQSDLAKGWVINLYDSADTSTRKKVLGKSVTIQGVVFLTAYQPVASNPNQCSVQPGTSYLYGLNLIDGGGALDDDGDPATPLVAFKTVDIVGVPTTPGIHIGGSGGDFTLIPNDTEDTGSKAYTKIFYWFRQGE